MTNRLRWWVAVGIGLATLAAVLLGSVLAAMLRATAP